MVIHSLDGGTRRKRCDTLLSSDEELREKKNTKTNLFYRKKTVMTECTYRLRANTTKNNVHNLTRELRVVLTNSVWPQIQYNMKYIILFILLYC